MGRVSEWLRGFRGRGEAINEALPETQLEVNEPLVEERKTTAEERVRIEHERAASFVANLTAQDRALVFQCFDEMWAENNERPIYLPSDVPLYHAGVVRTGDEVEDWPMLLSPDPKGCDEYSRMVNHAIGEVRSALVMETLKPRRLADFSGSSFDPSNLDRTPMGRLAKFTGGAKDKTRAHLARAWCEERRLDGYERRNADEVMIASPTQSLRTLEALDMESFRGKYLASKKPTRVRRDEER